jgi:uncharacterized protein YifE (UPF0438 family)
LAVVVEELLAREAELTWREEALTAREEKVKISKKALAQVSASPNEEQTKAEAAWQEYRDKKIGEKRAGRFSTSTRSWGRRGPGLMSGSGT